MSNGRCSVPMISERGGAVGNCGGYVKRVLDVISNLQQYPASARVSAGSALAYLGDPRDFDEMLDVPAGKFFYGDLKEEKNIKQSFRIGKYPVTNAQRQDGYGQTAEALGQCVGPRRGGG